MIIVIIVMIAMIKIKYQCINDNVFNKIFKN
jgi:hypothetical protein